VKPALILAVLLALAAPASAAAELAIGSRSDKEGWIVTVSARAVGLGPVDVATGPVRPAEGWGHVWLQHDLTLTNTGNRPVAFADTWTTAVLGPRDRPVLVATADERCGYHAVRPLRAVCRLPLIFVDIRPGRTVTRLATLWKGLRRMAPLEPGTYVFRQPFRFSFGKYPPAEGRGHAGAIKLVYRVEAGA
jgi:hypothetical protein